MELYEEVDKKEKSKIPMIIGICIGVLVIIIVAIICAIMYLRSTVLTLKLDGKINNEIEKILYIKDENNDQQIYIPIRKIAKFFNYEDYRGDYISKSEDSTKCYVKNDNEVAMFTNDSEDLIKVSSDSEYEYITLNEKVFEKDGELYTTPEGIDKAFNVSFQYNLQKNYINIFTMEYLYSSYAAKLKGKDGESDEISASEVFSDKKVIFQNMLIVIKNKQYGVKEADTNKLVLEIKYDDIKYMPATTDFLVKSNGKYGVIGKDASVKIKIIYDEIKIMDSQNELYIAKKNNLYGVIDKEGKVVIDIAYTQIGIDNTKYQQNGVESKYVLLDEIIPIKNSDGLWGLFDIKGKKIKDFEFTEIGCDSVKEANSYPTIVIPSHKIIVIGKEKHYNLITSTGNVLIPTYVLSSVYIKMNSETGENEFYMTNYNNDRVINVEKWLENTGN